MLVKFFAFCFLTLLFIANAFALKKSPAQIINQDLKVQQISDDVWLHVSFHDYKGQRVAANGMFIVRDSGIVIADTPWGDEPTEALVKWLVKSYPQPIVAVIASHFHYDSLSGLKFLNSSDIPIYVSPKTWTLISEEKQQLVTVLTGLTEQNPQIELHDVKVLFPGAAHSHDNIMVYYPQDNVLFGSCAVRSLDFRGRGNVSDADEQAWPTSISKALENFSEVKIVVPGHGKPGDASLLKYTISLFD